MQENSMTCGGRRQTRPPRRAGRRALQAALLSAGLLAAGSWPSRAQQARESCLDLVEEGRQRTLTSPTEAIELLSRAVEVCSQQRDASVREQERLRWQLALLAQTEAERRANRCEQYRVASDAVQFWSEYVTWYQQLSVDERASLGSPRIQRAVRSLQNSVLVRGEQGSCSPQSSGIREILHLLTDVPFDYVSADSVKLWKEWLWRCPSWSEATERSYAAVRDAACDESGNVCLDEWEQYRDYLERWLAEKSEWQRQGGEFRAGRDLSLAAIRDFSRELKKVRDALECESLD